MATYFTPRAFPDQYTDSGIPAANYIVHAFLAGTTTPTNMFTDNTGTVAGTTITLDANGYIQTSGTRHAIWLDSDITYDIELRDATDVTVIWIAENVSNSIGSVTFVQSGTGAVSRTVQDKLADTVSTKDFGAAADGATDDSAELVLALNTGRQVMIPENSVFTPNSSQAAVIVQNLDLITPTEITTITLPAGEISIADYVDIKNTRANNLIISGYEATAVTVSAVAATGGSAKNHSIQYTVSSVSEIAVNEYVLVTGSAGTGDYKVVEGCFKVTQVSGSNVTVKHTLNDAWPTLTVSSATCYPLRTILRWAADTRGMAFYGSSIREVRNVVIAGAFNITTGTPADSPSDGVQVGAAPNTDETGLNESEQTNAGSVWFGRVGIVEWEGNGVQVLGGNFYGTLVSSCSNGWRGFQAARNGSVIVKSSAAVGNGQTGYETEAMGFINANSSVSSGNNEHGYYAIGPSSISCSGCFSLNNVDSGIDARNFGIVLADSGTVKNNQVYGLSSTSGFILFGASATASNNTTADAVATEGGVINANGGASLGTTVTPDDDSGTKIIDVDGDLIYPDFVKIENANEGKIRFNISSIGDLSIGFDPSDTGTFTERLVVKNGGIMHPAQDNNATCGRSSERWSEIYAAIGTINTSDAREKIVIGDISEAEKKVAKKIKIKAFKFKQAVDNKADKARTHFGVIAQEIKAAFESEGLDPFAYGMLCYDEWDDEFNEKGEITTKAGNRYGIRYDELLCFIIAAL